VEVRTPGARLPLRAVRLGRKASALPAVGNDLRRRGARPSCLRPCIQGLQRHRYAPVVPATGREPRAAKPRPRGRGRAIGSLRV
jgi:hypothetical protein